MAQKSTRRQFLTQAGAAAAALAFCPAFLSARSPNEQLNLASVGVGGMGGHDLNSFRSHSAVRIAALCDVDKGNLDKAADKYRGAETFRDWREMLPKMAKKIDAVHCATPDHGHAPVAMTAIMLGKHVYCQKPLTHEIYEARKLTEAAGKMKVVTQMGIQMHSTEHYRRIVKIIQGGAIGAVKEVHSWSHKEWGHEGPVPSGSDPVPDHLDWDLWLGVAPDRPYKNGLYHQGNWRRWYDFGCGTMGDMSIHILDPVYESLALTAPKLVQSDSERPLLQSFRNRNTVHYVFPGTKFTANPLKLTWYDGSHRPRTQGWPTRDLPDQGSMFVGEKGYVLLPHCSAPKLLPEESFRDYDMPRDGGSDHYHQWVDACIGRGKCSAPFDYAGPLTEFVLLGVLANKCPQKGLAWDAKKLRMAGDREAPKMIRRKYRRGWSVRGL